MTKVERDMTTMITVKMKYILTNMKIEIFISGLMIQAYCLYALKIKIGMKTDKKFLYI